MTDQENPQTTEPQTENTGEKVKREGKRWVEEIEVAGRDAVSRAQELVEEGNVRRLIFMTAEDKVILEVPLTAGVAVGAVGVFLAPTLAAIGAAVAFLAKVKIQIVRVEDDE